MKRPEQCMKCLKLTVQTPERLQSRRSAVFVVNVRHILHAVLFLLGTRNTTTWSNTCCRSTLTILGYMNVVFVFDINFEQVFSQTVNQCANYAQSQQ